MTTSCGVSSEVPSAGWCPYLHVTQLWSGLRGPGGGTCPTPPATRALNRCSYCPPEPRPVPCLITPLSTLIPTINMILRRSRSGGHTPVDLSRRLNGPRLGFTNRSECAEALASMPGLTLRSQPQASSCRKCGAGPGSGSDWKAELSGFVAAWMWDRE